MRTSAVSRSLGALLLVLSACARTQSGSDNPSSAPPDSGPAGASGAPDDGAAGKPAAGSSGSATPSAGRGGGSAGRPGPMAAGSGGSSELPSSSCPTDVTIPALCQLCADGSCGAPVCAGGKFTGKWMCSDSSDAGAPSGGCVVGGCSKQLCTEGSTPVGSTCEWLEEYACYRDAACERQSDGKCGWTQTPDLSACLKGSNTGNLHWHMTCGDPVCRTDATPFDDPKIPNCTTQKLGGACSNDGELCDGVASCGAKFICSANDPSKGPCPISRARFKEEVEYLSPEQRREVRDQLMSVPLASYRYVHAPEAGPQLGFIIEDVAPSVAVSGDHVNMYGYLSMAVAAIQEQQQEIARLHREVAEQRATLRELSSQLGVAGELCGSTRE
jgi:hypothetical protein